VKRLAVILRCETSLIGTSRHFTATQSVMIAMLVADLVGPTGEVVGIERDANTFTKARSRVAEAQLRNVSFVTMDVSQAVSEVDNKPFDVIVGRVILEYLPEPGGVLRSLSKLVRPGGIIALA
jgi:tRNA A58 N-methylase Trm61